MLLALLLFVTESTTAGSKSTAAKTEETPITGLRPIYIKGTIWVLNDDIIMFRKKKK
jgi:hypothetical protein